MLVQSPGPAKKKVRPVALAGATASSSSRRHRVVVNSGGCVALLLVLAAMATGCGAFQRFPSGGGGANAGGDDDGNDEREPAGGESSSQRGKEAFLSRRECAARGGVVTGDVGDGRIHRPGYVCESNGLPPIATVVPLEGEPVAREGEVCCGLPPPPTLELSRQECVDRGNVVVPDVGDGSSRRPDYRCATNGRPIVAVVVPLPGDPIADEGEVCCGPPPPAPKGGLTRRECVERGGTVVGDIGNGAIFRPDYRCPTSGRRPLGIIAYAPGEPIAVEGEVCCGPPPAASPSSRLSRQECVRRGGTVVGDIGNGAIFRPGYRCPTNGRRPVGTVVPGPGEPVATEGEVCCGPTRRPRPRDRSLSSPASSRGSVGA